MDAGGFRLITLGLGTVGSPTLQFTGDSDTGVYSPAANQVSLAAGGVQVLQASAYATAVNFAQVVASQAGTAVTYGVAGSDTNLELSLNAKGTGVVSAATAFVPASIGAGPLTTNTPAIHALYRENVVKAWLTFKGTATASIYGSYNVTSLTRNSTGDYTINWRRSFAATPYAVAGIAGSSTAVATMVTFGSIVVGSVEILTYNDAGVLVDPDTVNLLAIGGQ